MTLLRILIERFMVVSTLAVLVACQEVGGSPQLHTPTASPQEPPVRLQVEVLEIAGEGPVLLRFPRQVVPSGEREVMVALFSGELTQEAGCLWVTSEELEERYLVIWPPGFSLQVEAERLSILDQAGRPVAMVGQRLSISGGEIPAGSQAAFEGEHPSLPIEDCAGLYWLAGDELQVEPSVPSEAPTPTGVPLIGLRSAAFVNAGTGWVLAERGLFWTVDDGLSWRDITPGDSSPEELEAVWFGESATGWALARGAMDQAEPGAQPAGRLFHTRDSATSWTSLPFPYTTGHNLPGFQMEFIDPAYGWVSVDRTETMNSSAADLYQTRDGGESWQVSRLPNNGRLKMITSTMGWLVGGCCTGSPRQLYRTSDGGATWQEINLLSGFAWIDYTLPTFLDSQRGLILGIAYMDDLSQADLVILQTVDGGETWQETGRFSAGSDTGLSPGIPPAAVFLDANTGWVAAGGQILATQDGGRSWQVIQPEGLPGPAFEQLSFWSQDAGWGLVWRDNCGSDCLVLVRTDDGGRTWESRTP